MLPYSLDVLFSVFGRYNAAAWPVLVGFYLYFPLALVWAMSNRSPRVASASLGLMLALAWGWAGVGFFWLRFANFDFVAPYDATVFVIQAGVLSLAGIVGNMKVRPGRPLPYWLGLGVVLYGLLLSPLVDYLSGQPPGQLRWFGLAPGATLVVTLGVLLLVRAPWYLWLLPILWAFKAGLVAWWLGLYQDLALPVLSLLLASVSLWYSKRYRAGE